MGHRLKKHVLLLDFSSANKSGEILEQYLLEGLKENQKTHYLLIVESGIPWQKYPHDRVTLLDWQKAKEVILSKEGQFWPFGILKKISEKEIKKIEKAEEIFVLSQISSKLMLLSPEAFLDWEEKLFPMWQLIALGTVAEGKNFSCVCTYRCEHLNKICGMQSRFFQKICDAHEDIKAITKQGKLLEAQAAKEYAYQNLSFKSSPPVISELEEGRPEVMTMKKEHSWLWYVWYDGEIATAEEIIEKWTPRIEKALESADEKKRQEIKQDLRKRIELTKKDSKVLAELIEENFREKGFID